MDLTYKLILLCNNHAKEGNLRSLQRIHRHHLITCNREGANQAARCGHLFILEWLEKQKVSCNSDGVYFVCISGRLDILKWLHSEDRIINYNILNDESCSINAAMTGQIHIIQWLYELMQLHNTMHIATYTANAAACNGHLHILQWLEKRNPPISCNTIGANQAARNGHLHVLKWLFDDDRITRVCCTTKKGAIFGNHKEIITWLKETCKL